MGEFIEWIKMHKASVLDGMTRREQSEFTELFGKSQSTIARLTAERDQARADLAASYDRAAAAISDTDALAEIIKKAVDAETRACIATVRKRIDDYVRECGSYDPSTGVTEFPGNGEEWISDMEEIEDDLTDRIDQRKEAGA